jgi:hypothetical protein
LFQLLFLQLQLGISSLKNLFRCSSTSAFIRSYAASTSCTLSSLDVEGTPEDSTTTEGWAEELVTAVSLESINCRVVLSELFVCSLTGGRFTHLIIDKNYIEKLLRK